MTGARVVVVGAGVVGLSIAYHLARSGDVAVRVCERDRIAGGSTGRSAGGIRLQFSDAANIRLAQRSVTVFEQFAEIVGAECDFRQYGYLLLATNPEDAALFRANVALQRSLDVPVEVPSPEEMERLVPGLRTNDVLLATFCPRDGYADPYSVAMGYAAAARRLGVEIDEGVEVTGIDVDDGRVTGVQTPTGTIGADVVVNAAGPWAARIAALAGITLPIEPFRRQICVTEAFAGLPERLPMIIDFGTHFYCRREGPGILMGMTDPTEPPGFDIHVDWGFLERIAERALHRLPVLATAGLRRGWAGLYDTTPDNNPILGRTGPSGFFVAAGFSGHGFMLSPAVGEAMAHLILTGRWGEIDLTPFGFERFAAGALRAEANVI